MADIDGHIELERSIDSITSDGVLVCGRRRLGAVKHLGWRTLKVWVRSGISDNLSRLLSEQDENALRKPLTPTEESALFEELKDLLAEDAARRQEASRFGSSPTLGGENGGADSAPPSPLGKDRNNAAKLVTGKASHQRLEQINALGSWVRNGTRNNTATTAAAGTAPRWKRGTRRTPSPHGASTRGAEAAEGGDAWPMPPMLRKSTPEVI